MARRWFPNLSRRGIIIVSVVAVIAIALVAWNLFMQSMVASMMANRPRPAIPVSAVTAQQVTWSPGIDAVGTAKAGSGADLAVEAGGVVRAINFTPNQRVASGQLLVQIDATVEEADMQAAQAAIRLATADVARIRPLVQRGAATQAQLDDAQSRLDTATAQLNRATAVADQKAITAPFGGVVGVPRVVVGQFVTPGMVVVTLQDIDRILVDFTVPEQSADLLTQGQKARFGVTTDDLSFSGELVGFDPKVDPQTRLISVRASVGAPVGRILPGQFLRVRVSLPEESGIIALPQTAVVTSLYGDFVYKVVTKAPPEDAEEGTQPTQIVRQTFVKTGRRDGERVEVSEGVAAGDIVVVAGQNRLQNGATVTIADDAVPGAPR